MSRRPTVGPAPDTPSDRRREALEALRGIRDLPRTPTTEETEAWIREVRLMGEASDLHLLEKMARAMAKPVAPPSHEDLDPRPESPDSTATNPLRREPTPRRPRARPDPATRTDRKREALEALRSLRALPRTRTKEETEAWIREVRLMREASTLHLLEKIERAITKPVPPPSGEDLDPRPDFPRLRRDEPAAKRTHAPPTDRPVRRGRPDRPESGGTRSAPQPPRPAAGANDGGDRGLDPRSPPHAPGLHPPPAGEDRAGEAEAGRTRQRRLRLTPRSPGREHRDPGNDRRP